MNGKNTKLKIYHGSPCIIEKPSLGKSKINNDYGQGFYCTFSPELAKEWAVGGGVDGYANIYSISEENLSVLNLGDGNYNILNWLAILLVNRSFKTKSDIAEGAKKYILENFLPEYKSFDVIRGYRADDSYFSFANDFLNNVITIEKLSAAMNLGKLGEQYVLKSEKAFESISFDGWKPASSEIYLPKRKMRDDEARTAYFSLRTELLDGHFMIDILREGWRNDDERLQRVIH